MSRAVSTSGKRRETRDTRIFVPNHLEGEVAALALADFSRLKRFGDFKSRLNFSNSGRGPLQQRSSMVSKTGTSRRRVARVRKSRASSHAVNSDSASERARRMEDGQWAQFWGMFSRCG